MNCILMLNRGEIEKLRRRQLGRSWSKEVERVLLRAKLLIQAVTATDIPCEMYCIAL